MYAFGNIPALSFRSGRHHHAAQRMTPVCFGRTRVYKPRKPPRHSEDIAHRTTSDDGQFKRV
jgi:hypothetical protein